MKRTIQMKNAGMFSSRNFAEYMHWRWGLRKSQSLLTKRSAGLYRLKRRKDGDFLFRLQGEIAAKYAAAANMERIERESAERAGRIAESGVVSVRRGILSRFLTALKSLRDYLK